MESVKVKVSAICGKICSAIGYTLGGLMTLGFITQLTDGKPSVYSATYDTFMYLLFFSLCGFLIYKGITIKRRIKRFKNYVNLISYSNITSLKNIAASSNQSIDFITKDIQKMIDKGYFKNAVINKKHGEVIIGKMLTGVTAPGNTNAALIEEKTVRCQSCGAFNTIINYKSTKCEYCGSPIN